MFLKCFNENTDKDNFILFIMDNYNFLTMGHDCSPAAALRNINLRVAALPFDWVVSSLNSIEKCFEDDFAKYHGNLNLNLSRTRLIDEYGFQFPHDYPLNNVDMSIEKIGEGAIGEEHGKTIINDWYIYHEMVKDKYNRRIERFRKIVNDPKPIIVLCRHSTNGVLHLQHLFLKHYKKSNIYFVNSSKEIFESDKIINVDTEKNGEWNEACLWKQQIDKIINININPSA